MKRTILIALLLAAIALSAAAQDQTPVFRAESTLVEFTLIAIDKDGNPVTDLKKEEIVVKDKGRPRDLALFRYEGGEQPRIAPPQLPTGIFTNTPDLTPGPPRNVTAIVLDTLNTQPREQLWVKAQAMRYLDALLANRGSPSMCGTRLDRGARFHRRRRLLAGAYREVSDQTAGADVREIDDMAREMENMISSVGGSD